MKIPVALEARACTMAQARAKDPRTFALEALTLGLDVLAATANTRLAATAKEAAICGDGPGDLASRPLPERLVYAHRYLAAQEVSLVQALMRRLHPEEEG
jgi:hypothetical protein